MADTTALKNRIRAAIKANDNQEITGPVLQQALLDMVDELNGATETEASQRQNGDSTLQQGINTERQARIDADNALGQRITEETQRAQQAEQTEQNRAKGIEEQLKQLILNNFVPGGNNDRKSAKIYGIQPSHKYLFEFVTTSWDTSGCTFTPGAMSVFIIRAYVGSSSTELVSVVNFNQIAKKYTLNIPATIDYLDIAVCATVGTNVRFQLTDLTSAETILSNLSLSDDTADSDIATKIKLALKNGSSIIDFINLEQASAEKAGLLPAKNKWDNKPTAGSDKIVNSNAIWIAINGDWKRESYNGTPSESRIRSPYITVCKHTTYKLTIPDGFRANICFYENGDSGVIHETGSLSSNKLFNTGEFNQLRIVIQPSPDGTITLDDLPEIHIQPVCDKIWLNQFIAANTGMFVEGAGRFMIFNLFYIGTSEPTVVTTYQVTRVNKCYYDANMNFIARNTYSSNARYLMLDIIINDSNTPVDYKDCVGKVTINGQTWEIKLDGTLEHQFADINIDHDIESSILCQSTDGENTNNLYHGLKDMELGTLNNGQPADSNIRLRSKDFIELPLLDGVPHSVNISINSTFRVDLYYYDENKEYIGHTDYMGTQVRNLNTSARYVKLLFRPNPDYVIPVKKWADLNCFISLYREDNMSLKKSIIANIDADMFDTSGSILRQEWINRNGSGDFVNIRMTTVGYIPIKPFTRYIVEKLVDADIYLEAFIYDKNYNYLASFGWNNSFFSGSACYAKFLYKQGDNENVDPLSFVPFTVKEYKGDTTKNYYPKYASAWEHGSLNDDGTNPEITVNYRARTDYLPIKSPGNLEMIVTGGWGLDIFLFDATKTFITSAARHSAGTLSVQVPVEAKYFRLKIMPVPDSTTPLELSTVANSGCNIYDYRKGTANSYLKHLKLTQWNMGLLNRGISTGGVWGIPNDELETKMPILKNIVTSIDADIIFINEYSTYVDRNQTMLTYDTLFKQFYGYKFTPFNGNVAIMSKYPINVNYEYDVINRPYITGEILIDEFALPFCLLHFSPYSYDDRTREIQALISKLSSFTQGIVTGDFNFGNNSQDEDIAAQIALFTNAGYVVGNYGYWGIKYTTPSNKALDNICAKGMNMSEFNVYNETAVADISDHYPTKSKVSFLIEK